MQNKKKGFSLIELLIVVAIILIIAAIAIPNLLRARITANETSAVGSVRTINTSAVQYSSTYGNGFPPGLAQLDGAGGGAVSCNAAGLIDSVLGAAPFTKSGYTFVLAPGALLAVAAPTCAAPGGNTYIVTATPVTVGTTGQRMFCTDQSGVIRYIVGAGPIAAPCNAAANAVLQ